MVTLTFRIDYEVAWRKSVTLQGVNATDFIKCYGPIFASSVFKRLGELTSMKRNNFGIRIVDQNELEKTTFVELGKRKKTRAYYCEFLNFVWVQRTKGEDYISVMNHNKMWNLLNR